jgi:hypothetical protein
MPSPIAQHLVELPNLSKDALWEQWEQLFASPPPPRLRRDLMVPILAHRLQEQAFGSLKASARSRLRQLARAFQPCPASDPEPA